MRTSAKAVAVLGTIAAAAAALLVVTSGAASASDDGPPLRISSKQVRDSMSCQGDLASGSADPVLLIPGTALNPKVNFDWNYEPAFRARHQAYCAVELPNNGMGDIQLAAEYVVGALRAMHSDADRRVRIVGFSQGGMIGRWALKFWPDTRDIVEAVIGLDPSNHGTVSAVPVCAVACAPAFWQQRFGSKFLAALNAGTETYPDISYTQIYTYTDEVVTPNIPPAAQSELHTGQGAISNVAVQQVCPVHVAEHLTMGSIDAVGYALVVDALTHDGLASADRIDRSVCLRPVMPGVDPVTLPANEARYNGHIATVIATSPVVLSEPPLQPYARRQATDSDRD
jgi:pimeloyl-ACP methyl ester carboxylesterase